MSRLGLRQTTGRTGSCFVSAAAESFFAVLKEEIGTRRWPDRATARVEILSLIETFSNRKRLRKHPHWGYLTPLEISQRHEQGHASRRKYGVSSITGKVQPEHRGSLSPLRQVP